VRVGTMVLGMTESYRQPVVETRDGISWIQHPHMDTASPYREKVALGAAPERPPSTSILKPALHTLGGLGLRGLVRYQRA
jgi:hypothetical protein